MTVYLRRAEANHEASQPINYMVLNRPIDGVQTVQTSTKKQLAAKNYNLSWTTFLALTFSYSNEGVNLCHALTLLIFVFFIILVRV
jgi:hypothetical protein